VLKQDHFAFDEYSVISTVIMGNEKLYKIMKAKDEIYLKTDFSNEDGIKASELEAEFAEMNGWEADSEAGQILAGLGIDSKLNDYKMKDLTAENKVKVLLAQALFGTPNVLLLDEPTNHLDFKAITWFENFLLNFKNTVIVVSHDRHFLNKVCTHMADIDFGKITTYPGNYDFWRKSCELALRHRSAGNKKLEEKAKDLKTFISRFSANASKSRQATSRQKQLEKLKIVDLPISSRKYPYVNFVSKREVGKHILKVKGLTKSINGVKILDNLSFTIERDDKVVFLSNNDIAKTTLFQILAGEMKADSGEFIWGVTITPSYFPNDNSKYFKNDKYNLIDWLRQYSEEKDESFIRGFLGKMLFSGEESLKKINILSGGEKVRCMLSKMMLSGANVLMLDGPTNHLDLESITSLNDGLAKFKGIVLFTSHDHEFIQTIANRIIEIDKTIIIDTYANFDDYLSQQ